MSVSVRQEFYCTQVQGFQGKWAAAFSAQSKQIPKRQEADPAHALAETEKPKIRSKSRL